MKLIFIGFISGIISGMGIGGGTVLIPSLVLFNDISQLEAQGINLVVFIPIAITAIITHIKEKNIEFKYTKQIILSGIISAGIGSFIATRIDDNNLRRYFGIFLLFIGLYEFFKKKG
ncbi:sulfite exporter TauE/SafE family protein [Wansuia hejianensis]|uniref:Probable membrane transporter protein n=1 Tax=Wansuia hejianensis TaxID=2763667 RepID=A0A926F2H5_9FIRM|nr:sulfite exporter TauE/SafE family protein [Wansuia hejianensis]MBC8590734.1 sulfite exporter TauE/SafE family protein [Wansuia hejianensis]